jgi:hypothetical protein
MSHTPMGFHGLLQGQLYPFFFFYFSKYYCGDKIKEADMGRAC